MSAAFDKLRSKLSELFQLDAAAELDFGIYRILNARRAEVQEFLDSLEIQVDAILAEALETGTAEWQAELEKVEAGLRAGGIGEEMIATAPRVRELRDKIAHAAADPAVLARDIFSHLATFFARYYKDGDFLSLRRYKKDTYAIPYEGEEVKLHWANADQYYIKSSETLRDYTFRLGPAPKDPAKADTRPAVTFKLVEADTEKDNTKAVVGQERRFIYQGLVADLTLLDPPSGEAPRLVLGFGYLPVGKKEKQADLNAKAAAAILAEAAKGTFTALGQRDATYTGKKKEGRTTLDKHLAEYTGRNTFDYFIHKDLGGFLRRELDFYIKNEVVHLDDLEGAPEASWRETRAQLKALRAIAGKVIRFLAQLEDFQKRLWLKKKFVVGCDYVVTLDLVPEELYPEIAACEAQREEWVRLFAIDEVEGYSVPLTVEFLKGNQGLAVDTRLSPNLTDTLEFSSCAESLAVKSDNAHALRLLHSTLRHKIRFSYIDPPYNTGGDDFCFKDEFQSSSWITMIQERLQLLQQLLEDKGVIYASIDAVERNHLSLTLERIFGKKNRVEEIIWVQNATKNQSPTYSTNHEYVLAFASNLEACKGDYSMFREIKPGCAEIQELILELNAEYPSIPEVERSLRQLFREHKSEFKDDPDLDDWKGIYNYNRVEYRNPTTGSFISTENEARQQGGEIWVWREDNPSMPQVKEDSQKASFRDPDDPTFRFYKPLHPVTENPCPHPKTGWRWPYEPHGNQANCFTKLNADNRIAWGEDESKIPQTKRFLHEVETNVAKSVVQDFTDGEKEMANLFGRSRVFSNPKPTTLIGRFAAQASDENSYCLDFFPGSGTTGHAVINLNREDGGDRKYILIEMGEHFDTVLVPRLKKVIYSKDWKDGKPQSRDTGISHCFKILRLESYEDTLNNLRLTRTREQELALDALSPEAREQYCLGYQLDLESVGSQSLLNVAAFTDPWNYTLDVATGSAGETRPVKVDLVETFHWLLGLTVLAQGRGGGVHWTEGTNPEGEKVLVLWRNTTEVDADALNEWCRKQKIKVLDGEFALIYVNGDHHLENLRRDDQTWKVRLIDEEFPRLMWEGCE
jgi:adenine-specific DNA-methyltransferase